MVVLTRYRDIPWKEVIRHYTGPWHYRLTESHWESELRGQSIFVEVPACKRQAVGCRCAGPFYLLSPNKDGTTVVCPHIAEIGD